MTAIATAEKARIKAELIEREVSMKKTTEDLA